MRSAIALITTTRSIGANTNFTFVEKPFEQIAGFVEDENNSIRIGDLYEWQKIMVVNTFSICLQIRLCLCHFEKLKRSC